MKAYRLCSRRSVEIKAREKTVHNLGKSTVARLIDFCLLKGRHSSFFLFKHEDIFANFTFFLELQLGDGNYITVARSVDAKRPVSILTSTVDVPDATELEIDQWSHVGLGISPAKRLLDGLFGFSVISPYDYRDIMGYVLREQDDYSDVFHLRKFRGKHRGVEAISRAPARIQCRVDRGALRSGR